MVICDHLFTTTKLALTGLSFQLGKHAIVLLEISSIKEEDGTHHPPPTQAPAQAAVQRKGFQGLVHLLWVQLALVPQISDLQTSEKSLSPLLSSTFGDPPNA